MRNVMKKAWEIARNGQKKFGGKVREYFAIALKMAWTIVKKGMEMVKLVGTESQVRWAESIRKNFIADLTDALASVKGNNAKKVTGWSFENNEMVPHDFEDYQIFKDEERFQESKAAVKKAIELAAQCSSAKFIIENREHLDVSLLQSAGLKGITRRFLRAADSIKENEIIY